MQSIGKFLPAQKLRLGTKAVISAILLIAVNTALVVGAARSMCAVAECAVSALPALSVEKYLMSCPSLVRAGLLDGS